MAEIDDLISKGFVTPKEYLQIVSRGIDCYFSVNGQLIYNQCDLDQFGNGVLITIHHRLRGGKGGFGSMLRAIGNQIEKTNNNDMCRDLSGRRIRDVNAEAKLKEWYANANERERAKLDKFLEKQKRRREALAKGPLHDHKFNDPEFNRRKDHISAELQDAVEEMLKKIVAESGPPEPSKKRRKLWIEKIDGDDLSGCSSDTDGDSDSSLDLEYLKPIPSTSERNLNHKSRDSADSVENIPESSDEAISKESEPVLKVEAKKKEPNLQQINEKALDFTPVTDDILRQAVSAADLEPYGLESLKQALTTRGLKCSGTLRERADRLFSVRDLDPVNYPVKLLSIKPKK